MPSFSEGISFYLGLENLCLSFSPIQIFAMNRISRKTTQNVSKALDLFNGMTEREYKEEREEDGCYKIESQFKTSLATRLRKSMK